MKENEEHFKFFIEDDESFEEYVTNMTKLGTWGGNLEIYVR
jgi:OTU domain-containing protein 3